MISFLVGRRELTEFRLQVELVDSQYRPRRQLLDDHLSQGVVRHCLYPEWKYGGDQQYSTLEPLGEDIEGLDELTGACAQINQFSMEELERGEGKVVLENYLHAALSNPE